MTRYVCPICGFVHDEATGEIFDSLPDSWVCPVCGAAKSLFEPQPDEHTVGSLAAPIVSSEGSLPGHRALRAHRVFGFIFLAVYMLLMVQMVPRLWEYQIEFPARTVVHLSLGMAVGVMLLLKIGIVRFFRRLDQTLVPLLGTSLLVSSVVLIGISVPSAFREAYATSRLFAQDSQERVATLLAQAGLDDATCTRYASSSSLREGQRILRHECIECHDLRTVLAKPRTPSLWRQTVRRMADRSITFGPLDEQQQWQVTAYLTALSPQLQKSSQQLSDQQGQRAASRQAAEAMTAQKSDDVPYDAVKAEE